jgi:hypothetical protein
MYQITHNLERAACANQNLEHKIIEKKNIKMEE